MAVDTTDTLVGGLVSDGYDSRADMPRQLMVWCILRGNTQCGKCLEVSSLTSECKESYVTRSPGG